MNQKNHQTINVLMALALWLFSTLAFANGVEITAARVWPAPDYTRIALEANTPVKHQLIILKNPDRLALDLYDVQLNTIIRSLPNRILSSDPYIKGVRVGQFKSNVVRIAIDLKQESHPNVFALPPAGEYKHRLVIDVNPAKDPLMSMVDKVEGGNNTSTSKPIPEAKPTTQAKKPEPTKPATKVVTQKPVTKAPKSRLITVVIDAGHGGEDPGAKGAKGSYEKHVTLAIAKKLKARIDQEKGMRGVLTRDGDYFIPLHRRVIKARKLQADLFISIHADSFTNPNARGSSVFALSERGATSASAKYLAKKENESDLIGGVRFKHKDPVLRKTLFSLQQEATINDSLILGKAVLNRMKHVNRLHKKHVEQAGFAVLKSPDIPSILVETAFISNPEEERKLNDPKHQRKLVESIVSGVKKYFASNPALAKKHAQR